MEKKMKNRNSRKTKRLVMIVLTVAMMMGSMTAFAFAQGGTTVLTVVYKNQTGAVLATKALDAADLQTLSSTTKVKYSSIDKMPAARAMVATGFPLASILEATSGGAIYNFNAGDTLTMTDVDGKKPFSVTFDYTTLYGTNRYYYPNLNETWVPAVTTGPGDKGTIITPGYLGANPTINGVEVQPFLATNYYQARYLKDSWADTMTLTPASPVTFCYGQTEAEVTALTPTNNKFIGGIDTITIVEAQ